MSARLIREYETIIVLRPDAADDTIASVKTRVANVFEKLDGTLIGWDDWGKRRLSYEVRDRTGLKKHTKGLYHYVRFAAGSDLVPELERNFRMLEPVMKYLTIQLQRDLIADDFLASLKTAAKEAEEAAEPAAAE
jgi:small subunit ribosomal protein S6